MVISDDNKCIEVEFEIWFDVDKKFSTNVRNFDEAWINMYAFYYPAENSLSVEYHVETDDGCYPSIYTPGQDEIELMTDMIEEAGMK